MITSSAPLCSFPPLPHQLDVLLPERSVAAQLAAVCVLIDAAPVEALTISDTQLG